MAGGEKAERAGCDGWVRGARDGNGFRELQRASHRIVVLFHAATAALVTLCSRSEHGPRKLVAWVDKSSDVFSKSRPMVGPWRCGNFFGKGRMRLPLADED
jgi:hypothetical protein